MSKELNLQIPDSLFNSLEMRAKGQGVSIEALCLSLLDGGGKLVEPILYSSMANGELRAEIGRVLGSSLPKEEIRKRVRTLETQITRFIK
jgi:hypothetical protein